MKLERIDHFTIRTHDLEATRAFYETALGLSIGWRPSFPIGSQATSAVGSGATW